MKRETKLVHEQLNVMRYFLTSFNMRDTRIYEIAKLLLSDVTNAMMPPEMSDAKEVQLCTNRRAFVPPKFKDEMCPKPPDHFVERIKTKKNRRMK